MYYTKQEEIDARNKRLVIFGAVAIIGMMLFLAVSSYFNQEEAELSLENLQTSGSSENSTNKETLEIRDIDGNKEIIINGMIVSEEEYEKWLNNN